MSQNMQSENKVDKTHTEKERTEKKSKGWFFNTGRIIVIISVISWFILSESDLFLIIYEITKKLFSILYACRYRLMFFSICVLLGTLIVSIKWKNKHNGVFSRRSGTISFSFYLVSLTLLCISCSISSNSMKENLGAILLILLSMLYLAPTCYSIWVDVKKANNAIHDFIKKEAARNDYRDRKTREKGIENDLEKFDFYTTGKFYADILNHSSSMIFFLLVSVFLILTSYSNDEIINNIPNMLIYFAIITIYWAITFIFYSILIDIYPDGVLTTPSPKYKNKKFKKIIDSINEVKDSQNNTVNSPTSTNTSQLTK